MNRIDCKTELEGEYNIKVIEGDRSVYESGWCRNTILAHGLQDLYTNSITSLTESLDVGTSTLYSGSAGYSLNGIVALPESSVFLNIPRSKHSIYNDKKKSTRVFYSYFASSVATVEHRLNEFAVKAVGGTRAFARNVFKGTVVVLPNQYIVFEYRLHVKRSFSFTSKLPFTSSSGHTFTVPCTGVCFNIPYNEVYRSDDELVLLNEPSDLPTFDVNWPAKRKFAVASRGFSTFRPSEIGRGLDNNTRAYSVSTVYANISAQPYGLYNQINTLLLSRNSNVQFSSDLPNSGFLGIKFKFPLALYNYENNFFDINGITTSVNENTLSPYNLYRPYRYYVTDFSKSNKLDICFVYSWRETN